MPLKRLLLSRSILLRPRLSDRAAVFAALADRIAAQLRDGTPEIDRDAVLAAVTKRERERSTCIGNTLALPHARVAGLDRPAVAIALLPEPLPYHDDGQTASIIAMVVTPSERPEVGLHLNACLAGLAADPHKQAELLQATDAHAAACLLHDLFRARDGVLTARDIMRPPGLAVAVDTPVREAVDRMSLHHLDVLPVCDTRHVVGEITTDHLLRYGLPDFFTKLHSISFVAEFDILERYFEQEARSTAGQLMDPGICRVPPDHTVLECAFALGVRRAPQLYVEDAGKWIGSIDRSVFLHDVLNF